jgi:hypothetical protein
LIADLRADLEALPPHCRDVVRRLSVSDPSERDAAAAALLCYPEGVIDLLKPNPDKCRRVVRLLAEIDAAG